MENPEDAVSTAVLEVLELLDGARGLDPFLARLGDGVREILGCEAVVVFRFDARWQDLYREEGGQELRVPLGKGIAGRTAKQGLTARIESVGADAAFRAGVDAPRGVPVREMLSAPLTDGDGRLIAVVQAADRRAGVFREADRRFLEILCARAGPVAGVMNSLDETGNFAWSLAQAFASGVDARYAATVGHSRRVRALALATAQAVELPAQRRRVLELAALLHDLGRIYKAEGDLDAAYTEHRQAAAHSSNLILYSTAIAQNIQLPAGLEDVPRVVRAQHEHWDGSGIPDGLAGEAIPLESRILLLADAVDYDLSCAAPDEDRLDQASLAAAVIRGRGREFDPGLVDVFLEKEIYRLEQRQKERFSLRAPVTVRFARPPEPEVKLTGEAFDVSEDGLLLELAQSVPERTLLWLRIDLAGRPFRAIGRVVRSEEREGRYRLGVFLLWQELTGE